MSTRLIHRLAAAPTRDITECLEGLFLCELLNPGQRLLVVSPWMSDFPALNNRGESLLCSTRPGRHRLSRSPVSCGPCSSVGSTSTSLGPGPRETELGNRIEQAASLDGTADCLSVTRLPHEHRLFSHEKALISDTWAVYGSMNLTYSGVTMNGELITVTTDAAEVAAVATELRGLFA